MVPDALFFGPERQVDLSGAYNDDKFKRATVRGLIHIFEDYKFTIEENTPIEEDVALDPELLGHVFENLLAAYNPETGSVARKTTGSFYTPRVAVGYMVDEALLVFLSERLLEKFAALKKDVPALETRLRHLFDWQTEGHHFTPAEAECLITAIHALKAIDIACGSGAFPMGLLLKLVWILRKLDPGNTRWKAIQLAAIPDANLRAAAKRVFTGNLPDYTRKLYLIENCLYGVDIQPIAVQIAKLRFFISLVVDQKVDDAQANRGVLPLPNLETKVVAANSLIAPKQRSQMALNLVQKDIDDLEAVLNKIRHDYFHARTYDQKKALRKRDRECREKLAKLLQESGAFAREEASEIALWNPYQPDKAAGFFDPKWMFNYAGGFDISIGNPPYVRQEDIKEFKPLFKELFECFTGVADLYVYFYERSFQILKVGGALSFISSNKYFRSGYGERLRWFLNYCGRIRLLLDFGDAPVFTAIAYPSIIIAQKTRALGKGELPDPKRAQESAAGANSLPVHTWEPGADIAEFPAVFRAKAFPLAQRELRPDGWRLESASSLGLLEQLRRAGPTLEQYSAKRIYYGIKTGLNEAFVVDRATRDRLIREHKSSAEVLKPFLRGRDVKRWRVQYADIYLIKIESSENKRHPWSGRKATEAEKVFERTYPAIHAHFETMRDDLIKRYDQGHYFWELRACVYYDQFEQPKLVIPAITDTVNYAADTEGFYSNDKTSICVPPSVPFALAIANSQVSWWISRQTFASKQGGFFEFKPMYVSQLPIPRADANQVSNLETISDYLVWFANQSSTDGSKPREARDSLMAAYWEQVLNGLVYELFFPDELHAQKLKLFDYVSREKLPPLADIPKTQRLARLRESFERLYASEHPVRGCLFSLKSLEPVRIIEGEK